ncbi:hypothetical protein RHA1_ro08910 (plasmid) [Rhodococcus jostii RHA1]|uniref:Uncharacterized protein n=1 Tax=Rhodococcus jostii (strain RHA1) TaxID=101510 RepID=Q0RXN2_RHOJR|nr:hypothetical protein RHA1_ro08910 [Rhodococcus jostii RHA1]
MIHSSNTLCGLDFDHFSAAYLPSPIQPLHRARCDMRYRETNPSASVESITICETRCYSRDLIVRYRNHGRVPAVCRTRPSPTLTLADPVLLTLINDRFPLPVEEITKLFDISRSCSRVGGVAHHHP